MLVLSSYGVCWVVVVSGLFSAYRLVSSFHSLVNGVGFRFGLGLSPLTTFGSGLLTGYGCFGIGSVGLELGWFLLMGCR